MGCTGVSMLMELDLWWWWEEQLLSIPREGNSFRILSHICRINIRLPFGSIPRGQKKKKKEKENCIRMAKQIHILALHEVQLWCGFTSEAMFIRLHMCDCGHKVRQQRADWLTEVLTKSDWFN